MHSLIVRWIRRALCVGQVSSSLACGANDLPSTERQRTPGDVPEPGAGGEGAGPSVPRDEEWTNGIAPLHTEGKYFKDPAGNIVILRGVATADVLEVDTERPGMNITRVIDRVSDAGSGFSARVVRLTVYPERYLPDPSSYLRDHLRPAVEHATSRGLYVILDWHEISDVAPVAERTAEFWRMIAPEFADFTNVLFELFNEPMDIETVSWAAWKAAAQPWVDQIREVAPENVILIGGPFWSQRIEGAATDPFEGENLAYVGHIYPIIDPGTWSPGGAMAQVAAVRPLMITEWGFRNDGEEIWDATRQSFGEPLRSFVEAQGLSWTAWCADSLWGPVMFDEAWNLLEGDGEMGGFVKEWLAERRQDDQPLTSSEQ